LDRVIAGSRVFVARKKDDIEVIKSLVMEPLESIKNSLQTSNEGVHVQASTLGSLEALLEFLKDNMVPVRSFNIGPVNVKDIKKATTVIVRSNQNRYNNSNVNKTDQHANAALNKTILAFDVKISKSAMQAADQFGVDIITSDIIYDLFTQFMAKSRKFLQNVSQTGQEPCIIKPLPEREYMIKLFNPITMGFYIELGTISIGVGIYLKSGYYVGAVTAIKSIETNSAQTSALQHSRVILKISTSGMPVVYGRDFFLEDRLFTDTTKRMFNHLVRQNPNEKRLLRMYQTFLGFNDNDQLLENNNNNDENNNNRH